MNPLVLAQYYGDAGTIQTLVQMQNMVRQSYLHPWIRERAALLAASCNRNFSCEHQNLTDFVRSAIHYIRDPLDTEILAEPVSFVESRLRQNLSVYGDCAQMVTYLASLLKTIGHSPQFKVIGSDQSLDHVFIECEGDELDPTMPAYELPQHYDRYMLIEA